MGSIKDRNGLDLTEEEVVKKRWQEYIEELYKKDLDDPDNHDGVICWLLRVKWHRTYKTHKRQTGHHSGQRNRTAHDSELAVYLYTSLLGRIPDCMTRLVQYSACAQMLSYSKREWNSSLLQSLSRALITRRECSLICKGPLISRLCPSPWQNILFASSTSPLSLLWPH